MNNVSFFIYFTSVIIHAYTQASEKERILINHPLRGLIIATTIFNVATRLLDYTVESMRYIFDTCAQVEMISPNDRCLTPLLKESQYITSMLVSAQFHNSMIFRKKLSETCLMFLYRALPTK